MKLRVVLLVAALLVAAPAWPVAKEIIQLQRDVALLSEQVRDVQRLITERMAVMNQLVEQSTDSVNKLHGALDNVQRTLANSLAAQGQKVDNVHGQLQALSDGLEEVKSRLSRLSEQVAQVRETQQTIQAPPQPATPTPAAPPAPKTLYDNALRDFIGGNLELAMQGFQDYLKYYPDTDLAGNAQFYIGEVLYRGGKFSEAVNAYNVVLEKYPGGNKTAAAHLKKGFALLEIKQRDAAVRELRALLRRFPNSDEARLARERLRTLGIPVRGL